MSGQASSGDSPAVPLVVLMLATSLLGLLAKGLEMLEEQGLKVVARLAG